MQMGIVEEFYVIGYVCLGIISQIYKSDSSCFPILLLGRIPTPITFKSKQEPVKKRVKCYLKLTGKRNKARIGHKRFCIKDGKLCSIALNILNRTFRVNRQSHWGGTIKVVFARRNCLWLFRKGIL